ncbi:MAG: class I mannose-6-phosphate isomerase [Acidobacteria bacterium]|nr:class I mannose-6-phosphate isomerase [Acidobacteriota bacterium]MBV9147716.1 class I mannose-6-phosphate isomerase [Acidobacteriota bacterium]MBV9435227.1 class I mannose-6-phosphate isomerase [Acidobacteriota bacterium]
MSDLYPLLLIPEFHERVWGSRDLSAFYPSHRVGSEPIGEVWLTGEGCRVGNGPLQGRTLAEVVEQFGPAFYGTLAPQCRFPLLMKIIFPNDKLSVQVHPDDEIAQQTGLPCGKTECWYVLSSAPNATVALGLRPGTTSDQVRVAIRENKLEELLNWVPVKPGDMIYVDAGTVHAIGPGCILLETQQNSDTTYRLYDYGRPRELHVDRGLQAMKEVTRAGKVRSRGGNGRVVLISSPCFEVDKMLLKDPKTANTGAGTEQTSPHCIVGLRGCGLIECEGASAVSVGRGEAVVIPASTGEYRIRPQWEFECVRAMVPGSAVAEPQTELVAINAS